MSCTDRDDYDDSEVEDVDHNHNHERGKMTLMIWCEKEVRTWKEVAFEPPSVVIAQNSTSSESS